MPYVHKIPSNSCEAKREYFFQSLRNKSNQICTTWGVTTKTNRYIFGSLSEMNATANKKTAVYFTMSEYETADTLSIKPIKYYVCMAQI